MGARARTGSRGGGRRLSLVALALALGAEGAGCRRKTPEATAAVAPIVQPDAAPPEAASAPIECGEPGQPACPLAAWMELRIDERLSVGDLRGLSRALRALAADAPPGYETWERWAILGAVAAERRDEQAIERSCRGCHNEYRAPYRRDLRGRAAPPDLPPPDAAAP